MTERKTTRGTEFLAYSNIISGSKISIVLINQNS